MVPAPPVAPLMLASAKRRHAAIPRQRPKKAAPAGAAFACVSQVQREVEMYSSLPSLTLNMEIAPPLMSPFSSKVIWPVTPA